MKKKYVTPMFVAERYEFNESIADCTWHIADGTPDPSENALIVTATTSVCGGDGGHRPDQGAIWEEKGGANAFPLTIFNDTADNNWNGDKAKPVGCDYDWNGKTATLKGETITGDFRGDFLGYRGEDKNHRPGFDGKAFWS